MSLLKLSIILPIYNVENYLERCVDSILDQSLDQKEYEVIFVDDGSTDQSGKKADTLSKKFVNSIVIHKENGGLSSARNAGLDVASGEYVFMIDSDDWIEKDAFHVIIRIIESAPDIIKFNAVKKPSGEAYTSFIEEGIYDENGIKEELLPLAIEKTGAYLLSAWSHIYRNSFLKDNNLRFVSEREIGSEDYLFNIHALLMAKKVVVIKDILYNYDFREGSLTNRYRKNLFTQYDRLHMLIQDVVNCAGLSEKLRESISFSYIEKFINVCLRNECVVNNEHTIHDGRKNVHHMIETDYFKEMSRSYPYKKGKTNRYILLSLLKMHFVMPVFFLLRR